MNWHVERGRGKRPKLCMKVSKEDLLLMQSKLYVEQEKYHDAFHLIESASLQIQQQFKDWFLQQFHHSSMQKDVDIFRYPFYETGLIMDPMYAKSRHDAHMVQQIFNRLVEFNRETNQLEPSLAHYWESEDGINWYFYLHKGIQFHNGKQLTSMDVKYTFERLRGKLLFKQEITHIIASSPTTIHFQLLKENWIFPRYVARMVASIVPADILREVDERQFKKFPIGSGPYQLTKHDKDKLQLEAFDNYFATRPWIDRVEIIQTSKLFQDELDPPFLLESPHQSWRKIKVIEEGAEFILFNDQTTIGKNPIIREAIYNCIDSDQFQKKEQRKIPAYSFLSEQSQPASLHEMTTIKESGLIPIPKAAFSQTIRIAAQQIREDAHHRQVAIMLKQQLENVGICATVNMLPVERFYDEIEHYDIFVGGVMLGEDRLLSLISFFQGNNLSFLECIHDKHIRFEVMKRLTKIKQTKREQQRWEIYKEIEDLLIVEHYLYFLSHRTHTIYEPSNQYYGSLKLDQHGRVDYRKIWKRPLTSYDSIP